MSPCLQDQLVLACVNGFKYCTQQVADSEAVETGSRPLTARDRNAIVRKTPIFARSMEYDGGARAPVSTLEHLPERQKRPKNKTAASAAVLEGVKEKTVVEIEPDSDAALRDVLGKIHLHGLPAGSVVQCRNDETLDEWLPPKYNHNHHSQPPLLHHNNYHHDHHPHNARRYMRITDGTVCEAADPERAHLKSARWLESNSTTKIDHAQPPTQCFIGTILRVL
jgi:hypothetical protein